jgi:hypothetical protein
MLYAGSWYRADEVYATSLLYPSFSRGFGATCYQTSRLARVRQAYFATAFTALAAFSMSAATAFGCDT